MYILTYLYMKTLKLRYKYLQITIGSDPRIALETVSTAAYVTANYATEVVRLGRAG